MVYVINYSLQIGDILTSSIYGLHISKLEGNDISGDHERVMAPN